MGDFQDKVALVTGGGAGIGRAISEGFAAQGARVIIADIDAAAGEATVAAIKDAGGQAAFIPCDVSDAASVDGCFDAAVAQWGRIDCAVNNAGIDPEFTADATWDIAIFDRIHAINVRGVALCMKREIEQMLAQGGGSIVNMGSLAGLAGVENKPYYCASKHAVLGITKAAGLRYARDGIIINAVCPGMTQTGMLDANLNLIPDGHNAMAALNPARRIGNPSEMAEAVLFLSSHRARYIVGHALAVDGGIAAA